MHSQILCRFGQRCHRSDCTFQHPEGRHIDGPATGPSSSSRRQQRGGAGSSPGPAAQPAAGLAACKFGWSCQRIDCYFHHPEGRAIDQRSQTPAAWLLGPHPAPTLGSPSPRTFTWPVPRLGLTSGPAAAEAAQCNLLGDDQAGTAPAGGGGGGGGLRHTEVVGPAMLALLRERFGQGLQGLAAVLQLAAPPAVFEARCAVCLSSPAAESLQAAVGALRGTLQALREDASLEQTEVPIIGSTRCLLGPGGELRAVLTAGRHVSLAVAGFGAAVAAAADAGPLGELFRRHGRVVALRVLRMGDVATARVTMGSVGEAEAAQAALHNMVLPHGGGRLTVTGYQPPCARKLFRPGNLLHLSWTAGRPVGVAFVEFSTGASAVRSAVAKANQNDSRAAAAAALRHPRRRGHVSSCRKGMLKLAAGAWVFAQTSKASRRVLQLKVCADERDARVGPAIALLGEPERLRRALEEAVGPVTKLTVLQEPDPSVPREQQPTVLAAQLQSLLQQYGALVSLDVKPYDTTRQVGKAFASFSSAQACTAARQALDGCLQHTWLGGRRPLRAHSDVVCRLRLDARCHAALRGRLAFEVARLRALCPEVKVSIRDLDRGAAYQGGAGASAGGGGSGGASIKVQGTDIGQVVRAKRELESAISGKLVTLDEPEPAAAEGGAAADAGPLQAAMLFLLSAPGKALIKQIEAELSNGTADGEGEGEGDVVHIRWDRALGQLRIFGSNDASMAAAEQRLRRALQDRQACLAAPTSSRPALSQPQFRCLLAAGGQAWLDGLADRHGLAAAALAFMPLGVTLTGETAAVEAAAAELRAAVAVELGAGSAGPHQGTTQGSVTNVGRAGNAAAAAIASRSVLASAPAGAQQLQQQQECRAEREDEDGKEPCCPVCFCPPEGASHKLLLCGHTYCRACLQQLLTAAASCSQLPARCCAAGCASGVSLRDCLVLLGPEQMERVHRSAFQAHIARHPEAFGCCLTPDCGQVYPKQPQQVLGGTLGRGGGGSGGGRGGDRGDGGGGGGSGGGGGVVNDAAPMFNCDCCLMSWCTSCQVPWHAGQTCAEFKAGRCGDSEFQAWVRKHTKPCPRCNVPIEKNTGCNHMTCSNCKAHFCWLCGEAFGNGQSTYDHLSSRHGGIYDHDM